MTPSDLKFHVENNGHDSHFFSRSSMKFAGDTMRNYGVRSATVRTAYDADGNYCANHTEGVAVECWELYRKRPVKHGLASSVYFAKDTFRRVFPVKD